MARVSRICNIWAITTLAINAAILCGVFIFMSESFNYLLLITPTLYFMLSEALRHVVNSMNGESHNKILNKILMIKIARIVISFALLITLYFTLPQQSKVIFVITFMAGAVMMSAMEIAVFKAFEAEQKRIKQRNDVSK